MSKALLAVGLVVLAVGCTHTPGVDEADTDSDAHMQQVTGTLSYRERLMRRPGTVADVSLLDVSRAVLRHEDRLLFTTDTVIR